MRWRSGLVHWDDPEGWDGEGEERGVQDGDACTPVADSVWQNHSNIVISLQLK